MFFLPVCISFGEYIFGVKQFQSEVNIVGEARNYLNFF